MAATVACMVRLQRRHGTATSLKFGFCCPCSAAAASCGSRLRAFNANSPVLLPAVHPSTQSDLETLATYYDLPSLSLRAAAYPLLQQGDIKGFKVCMKTC